MTHVLNRRLIGPALTGLVGLVVVAGFATTALAVGGVPGAPRSVTATAGNARITVGWLPPTSDGGSAVTSYTASCASGAATRSTTVGGTARRAVVTGLSNGTAYSCSVLATNANGPGPASAAPAATPAGPPSAPRSVLASTRVGKITVTWQAPASTGGSAVTGYGVLCTSTDGGPDLSGSAAGTARSAAITGLPNDTTYACRVTASNARGTSPAGTAADDVEHAVTTASVTRAVLHLPVAAGQRVSLVAGGSTFPDDPCTRVSIDGTGGSPLTDSCLFRTETVTLDVPPLPTGGTATATVAPPAGVVGSVELAGYVFVDVARPITAGGPVVSVLTPAPRQDATLSFTGRAGEVVSLVALPGTIDGSVSLQDPTGREIAYSGLFGSQGAFLDATTLPGNGTYRIVVDTRNSTGASSFRLYDVPADTGTIAIGGAAVPVTITTPGENARRAFAGTAGRTLTLDVTGNTLTGLLSVRTPADGELGYVNLGSGSPTGSVTVTLPTTGSYTVLVDPSGPATGKISLRLHP